MSKIEKVAI